MCTLQKEENFQVAHLRKIALAKEHIQAILFKIFIKRTFKSIKLSKFKIIELKVLNFKLPTFGD